MYRFVVKRLLDVVLSILALAVLCLPMLIVAVAIKIDSPGPVFFKQKRIAKGKGTFTILKFRSMPTSVPHDTPTHQFRAEDMLSPFQRFIRRSSIDELPQLFCTLTGQMSLVGPRPALWNQYDLVEERDKYGANDVKPGITGWAQVNGRDELEIPVKAKLDGEYAAALRRGGFRALSMDCKCLWMTVASVLNHEGVVEGGTGAMKEGDGEKTSKGTARK